VNDATTTKPDTGQQQPVRRRPSRRVLLGALAGIAVLAALGTYLWRQRGANDPNGAFSLSGNVDVHQVELAAAPMTPTAPSPSPATSMCTRWSSPFASAAGSRR
jgi:hypothetical protein